jgi:ABC-type sugar transport system substrate-binding protein
MSTGKLARTSAIAALGAALVLTASACSTFSSGGSSGGSGSSGTGKVGYSESFLTDPFQVQLVKQISQQAKKQGVDVLPATNANNDPGKQSTDIQTLLGEGVKGLILAPIDSDAISPAISQANAKNVPVVTVDKGPSAGHAKAFMIVRANNVQMGQEACQAMGKALGGKGTVLNLQGDLSDINGQDRSNGFTKCMSKTFPSIKVISKPMKWDTEQCGTQTQTVVSTTHIDGLFEASESVCLNSVEHALKSAGKLVPRGKPGHIYTAAIDGTPPGLAAVRSGLLDVDVSQPLNLYAQYAVYYVKAAMAGKTFKPGPDGHGGSIVKFGNSLMDLLPPSPVTAANANDKTLWGNAGKS